jgi:hypothetical protein
LLAERFYRFFHGYHAGIASGLMDFVFADEIANGRGSYQYFTRCYPPVAIAPGYQLLAYYPLQGGSQLYTYLGLLVGRKNIYYSFYGLGGIGGMQ